MAAEDKAGGRAGSEEDRMTQGYYETTQPGASAKQAAKVLDFVSRNERQRIIKTITIDSNEQDPMTPVLLRGMGYDAPVHRLLTGDYSWALQEASWFRVFQGLEATIMERKTPADIKDTKRLMAQLARMTDPKVLYIVLIDMRSDNHSTRWSDDALDNAGLSLQVGKILVAHCAEGHLASRIDSLWKYTQKHRHSLAGGE